MLDYYFLKQVRSGEHFKAAADKHDNVTVFTMQNAKNAYKGNRVKNIFEFIVMGIIRIQESDWFLIHFDETEKPRGL